MASAALDGSDVRAFSAGAYWGIKRGASSAFVAFAASGDTSVAEAKRARQVPVPQSLGVVADAPFSSRIGNVDVDEFPIRGFTALLSPVRDEVVWTRQEDRPSSFSLLSMVPVAIS